MSSIHAQPSRIAFAIVLVGLLVAIGFLFRWLVTPPSVEQAINQRAAAAERPRATAQSTVAVMDTAPSDPGPVVIAPPPVATAAVPDDLPAASDTAGWNALAGLPRANAGDGGGSPTPRQQAILKQIDTRIAEAKAKRNNAELNHLLRLRTDIERGTALPTVPNPSASAPPPRHS